MTAAVVAALAVILVVDRDETDVMQREIFLDVKPGVREYFTLAERLAAVDGDTVLTASLVDQVIECVTVNGPEDVSVQFRFADEFENLLEALGDA